MTLRDDELNDRYDVGREVARRAGALAREYASRLCELDIRWKGAQDVVTEADLAVEQLIRQGLARFDSDGFLGEESGADGLGEAEGVWVVDPIDGSQPFVSGLPDWCVSIAFVHHGKLQFGFVDSPALDEFFEGGRGRPALLNGQPVHPNPAHTLADGVVGTGHSPGTDPADTIAALDRLLRSGGTFYTNGSAALSICYVACGRLIGYIEPHVESWDCLGALAILEAAGGRSNDFLIDGALLSGNRIVAGPPAVLAALDALLGSQS